MLEIVTIPCLSDNYAFLLHDAELDQTALIDAPEAGPIQTELDRRGWTLNQIVLTHHHYDHIDGVPDLRGDAQVIGAAADVHRLPPLDLPVADGDRFDLCGAEAHVMDVSGHTIGHIAVHVPAAKAAFTADSLMALGCGRVFEGSMDQMWESLSKLAALPRDTLICSGHEYTAANAKFAISVDPDNGELQARADRIDAARKSGTPTVPSVLEDELATNPFLRAPKVARGLGLENLSDAEAFAEIRRRKDAF